MWWLDLDDKCKHNNMPWVDLSSNCEYMTWLDLVVIEIMSWYYYMMLQWYLILVYVGIYVYYYHHFNWRLTYSFVVRIWQSNDAYMLYVIDEI